MGFLKNMKFCVRCGFVMSEEENNCLGCSDSEIITKEDIKDVFRSKATTDLSTSKNFKLLVTKGGTDGREFFVNKENALIGRWDPKVDSHPDVDLSDEDIDSKVSRLHAQISSKPEGFYIEDLGSKNGTYLNREFRLVKGIEYKLQDNDEIIVGKIFFKFKVV